MEHKSGQFVHSAPGKQALRAQRIHNFMRDAEPHSYLRDTSTLKSEIEVIRDGEELMAEKLRSFEKAFN